MNYSKIFYTKHRITLLLLVLLSVFSVSVYSDTKDAIPVIFQNLDLVKEVLEGKRTEANASWWGFNEHDSTAALQGAINSGAKKIVVPYMGKEWIVRPIKLKSNQEIIFEPGVVVTAKKGEFKRKKTYLFLAHNIKNVTLRGYGATLRMRKKDYEGSDYIKSEHRTVLGILGSDNIKVLGLTLRDSGGDGIVIFARNALKEDYRVPCRDVIIKDCILDNNYRQGITVSSVENLLIENCILKNTNGTWPKAGIDIEPSNYRESLSNIVISNCISENNAGPGFQVFLGQLSSKSKDVTVLFVDCYVKDASTAIKVGAVRDDGPKGLVEFRNCTVENANIAGVTIFGKSKENVSVRFNNCKWKNTGLIKTAYSYPILLSTGKGKYTEKMGGVEFVDCYVYEDKKRPFIKFKPFEEGHTIFDIKGNITVVSKYGAITELGKHKSNVNLKITSIKPEN